MTFLIEDLPTEVIVIIFQHLSIKDLQNCSQTCRKWEKIVVQFFFKPQLRSISKFDDFTKKYFQKKGWNEECDDTGLILSLHRIYHFRSIPDT